MLRYVGDTERFSTVQHFQGFYRCVAVTARYTMKTDMREFDFLLGHALTKVVLQHPILCVGIVGEQTNEPAFVRLSSINLAECVEYQDNFALTPGKSSAALENILERQHSRQWRDLSCRPGWKIIIVQSYEVASTKTALEIVFAYHHALADGVSGLVFHHSLLEAFKSTTKLKMLDRIVEIPETTSLPLPLEKQINFTASTMFLLRESWKARPSWMKYPGKNQAWTSTPPSLTHIQNYKSRTKIISIGPDQLASILESCRRQNVTLTGLLHGILVVSMTFHVPQAKGFIAGVPYSLRYLLDESSKYRMGCYAWGCSIDYTAETISKIRSTGTHGQLTNEIWEVARVFLSSVTAELAHIPKDNFIGLIPKVKDLHKAFKSRIGKTRAQTFEVSNIGVFKDKTEEYEGEEEDWKIEKMVFSQSGIGTGAAVSFNVVSVAGGPLAISATWLDGAIEETLVSLLCGDILHILDRVSRVIATSGGTQQLGAAGGG